MQKIDCWLDEYVDQQYKELIGDDNDTSYNTTNQVRNKFKTMKPCKMNSLNK